MSFITERIVEAPYRARSVRGGYPGDWVEARTFRTATGKRFRVVRIKWGDGSITLRAHPYNSTTVLHEWIAP